MNSKKNKLKFFLETDWLFDGIIDSEQKQYILLSYFQKLNKSLEEMKVYPMFTELSLHLANIQTLMIQNQMLYTDKDLESYDDEILLTDLKVKDAPVMAVDEYLEYQKILKYSHPKLQDYFGITKSFWAIVYDAIQINLKKNKSKIDSKTGFFYYNDGEYYYIWRYNVRKVNKVPNQYKTHLKEIFKGKLEENLTIYDIILNFLNKNSKKIDFPVFEVVCNEKFPLQETLLPIFKRKIMAYIQQTKKKQNSKIIKQLTDGVQ